MTWAGIASTVVGAGVSLYGQKKQSDAMKKAATQATPIPYSTYSPWGSVQFDNTGKAVNMSMAQNPFAQLFQGVGLSSLANAGTAPGSYLYGADPELAAAYQGLTGPGLETAAADRYNILNQLAQPNEQRAYNNMQDQLFATGRLGTSGGGIQQEAFYNAQAQADLQRQMASQDWAASRAQNRFGAALQSVGSGQAGQLNQFNMGAGSLGGMSQLWQNLLQSANVGLGAASGTPQGIAAMQAQAAGMPYQTAYSAMSNAGLFDWLGGKIGGWMGGGAQQGPSTPAVTPTGAPVVGGTATNPYGIDFGSPGWQY